MTKEDVVLAGLAASKREAHTSVQVQKLFFLLDRKIPEVLDGPHFDFEPYHYGPFDKDVPRTLDKLSEKGLVEIVRPSSTGRKTYRTSREGQKRGEAVLDQLPDAMAAYVGELSDFVLGLSFAELVRSIYAAYPEMKVNSLFQQPS